MGDQNPATDEPPNKNSLQNGSTPSRIEPIPRPDFPHHLYPRWIGHKFLPNGDVRTYPGNTVLAHLPSDSPFRGSLHSLLAALQAHELASAFVFLPPSSWHMTIYESVTDQIRQRHSYPGDLSLDSDLKVCHAHIATRLADFEHGLGAAGVGRMTVVGFEPLEDGIGLTLQPESEEQDGAMRSLRDAISGKLRMRHPGHEHYTWHMSIGYTLRQLSLKEKASISECLQGWLEEAQRTFELRSPEFCVYDDMCQFRRVFYLD